MCLICGGQKVHAQCLCDRPRIQQLTRVARMPVGSLAIRPAAVGEHRRRRRLDRRHVFGGDGTRRDRATTRPERRTSSRAECGRPRCAGRHRPLRRLRCRRCPRAIRRVVKAFEDDPALAAVFGSYDRRPRAPGLVSQYRNLLHHYTHQIGNPEAGTFWSGCGAIRRSVFVGVGGFDAARFPRPSIEDSNWAIACASQVIGSSWIGRFREPTSGGGDCGLSTEPTSPAAPYPWRD
jgi:hypothetical protein